MSFSSLLFSFVFVIKKKHFGKALELVPLGIEEDGDLFMSRPGPETGHNNIYDEDKVEERKLHNLT